MDLEKSSLQSLKASTGPEQGFPCVVFSHRENPVFIAGIPVDENRFFPVGNTTQGKPCFHYRDGFAVYLPTYSIDGKKQETHQGALQTHPCYENRVFPV